MTDRVEKILKGKRERALSALEDENRKHFLNGFVALRDDEAKTLLIWIKELIEKKG